MDKKPRFEKLLFASIRTNLQPCIDKITPLRLTRFVIREPEKYKTKFFDQINTLIDWKPIKRLIDKHYIKGQVPQASP